MSTTAPPGYLRVAESGVVLVARSDIADAVVAAWRAAPRDNPTLHGYASRQSTARLFTGRDIAFALTLPDSDRAVVVRHNRHGGALRALTGDVFLMPTRAPGELKIALHLKALGVPTPAVLAYAVYPAGIGFGRSDVVTEEIADSSDLGEMLLETTPESGDRRHAWNAATRLLEGLAAAGVRHHDLNVKNILLRPSDDDIFTGFVLDVDRVEFDCTRSDALAGNRARLRRSVEKWRRTRRANITEAEIDSLRNTATSMRRPPSAS